MLWNIRKHPETRPGKISGDIPPKKKYPGAFRKHVRGKGLNTFMSVLLRAEMILLAVLVVGIIVRFVNSQRLRVQYSLVWFLIALALLTAAFFPGLVFHLCALLGMEKPSNLVYLVGIVSLLLITFYQTVLISRLSDRVTRLTQIISIEKFLTENESILPDSESVLPENESILPDSETLQKESQDNRHE